MFLGKTQQKIDLVSPVALLEHSTSLRSLLQLLEGQTLPPLRHVRLDLLLPPEGREEKLFTRQLLWVLYFFSPRPKSHETLSINTI